MNIEEIREYCLSKSGVTEELPFNDTALVFKVAGKMYALLDLSEDSRGITLKCNPELAIDLRERFTEVIPAYHFNKKHWIGVDLKGNVPTKMIRCWIDHSYELVRLGLAVKIREQLERKE